jgi:hypothetical protein
VEAPTGVTKECSAYNGLAGDFCTITSSNLEEIEVGSRVVYAEAAGDGSLDSDIVLEAGPGNTADGHVKLDLAAGSGVVTFSGGTGKFTGFQARVDVFGRSGRTVALGRNVQLQPKQLSRDPLGLNCSQAQVEALRLSRDCTATVQRATAWEVRRSSSATVPPSICTTPQAPPPGRHTEYEPPTSRTKTAA